MKYVYAVIFEDRHYDVTVEVFTDKVKAIEYASTEARKADRFGELNETIGDSLCRMGCVYRGCYSCEGDCIRVMEVRLDKHVR